MSKSFKSIDKENERRELINYDVRDLGANGSIKYIYQSALT